MKNDIKFEKIHSNKKNKSFFVGIVCVVILLITLVLTNSFAKYRSVSSVPIVNSEVNYMRSDLNAIAMYVDGEKVNTIPEGNYKLTNESYCEINGEKDSNIILNYDSETRSLSISPFTTKGTKCYLYFEEAKVLLADVIKGYNQSTRSSFSSAYTTSTTNTVFTADDNDGITYYFAGNPTDNYVSFAGFYWRIIRVNGDGSIRIIYQGTTANGNGKIDTGVFNKTYGGSEYVGFKYTAGNQHGVGTESTILEKLNEWYNEINDTYKDVIDINAGFCGDRNMESGYTWSSNPSDVNIYYASRERILTNKTPSFKCSNNSDLYTVSTSNKGNKSLTNPIGLITADEVAFAGGVYNITNDSYYLYTGSNYWTMSPSFYDAPNIRAGMFFVRNLGQMGDHYVTNEDDIRPVINLKADVTVSSGNGSSQQPFVIESN